MKLPRRAAALIAAFLMAVSLVLAPQPSRAWFIDGPLSNPPPREGDPDVPNTGPLIAGYTFYFSFVGPLPIIVICPSTIVTATYWAVRH
jgi:hypothetical protein